MTSEGRLQADTMFSEVAVRKRVGVGPEYVQMPEDRGTIQEGRASLVPDPVEHPAHYTGHPSGVECITITEHMGFCLGNAIKYIWRADLKADALEDLRKARWYLDREIARRQCITERDLLASRGD